MILALTNCTQKNKTQSIDSPKLFDKAQLIGIWTDRTTENATFQITRDSVYYVDSDKTFMYKIKNDSIVIDYIEFSGSYKILKLNEDSLVLGDKETKTIFTKFEN